MTPAHKATHQIWAKEEASKLWHRYALLQANRKTDGFPELEDIELTQWGALFTLVHQGLIFADLDGDDDAAAVLRSANQPTATAAEREAFSVR
jgi:hypothetical protein